MEQDETFQYTQFPDLNTTHQSREATASLRTKWQGNISSLPDEVLILAWASLLQAFTRVSSPVFLLNARPVSVDIQCKSRRSVQVRDIPDGAGRPSSLVLPYVEGYVNCNERPEETSSGDPKTQRTTRTSLSFQYDRETGCGLLWSSGNVPESFLGELERQLLQIICLALGRHGCEGIPQSSTAPSLSVVNAKRKHLQGPSLLHELISKHGAKSSTAIDFLDACGERTRISYARLDHLTNTLARIIAKQLSYDRSSSLQPWIIPVLIPQCLELYCAWIAVLKAGAAFCPIGVDVPSERMKYILKDIDAKTVLTLPEFTSNITEITPDVQIIEVQAALGKDILANGSGSFMWPPTTTSSDSLAYVMYTSGSTGLPKGVAVPHNAVTQALLAHDEHIPKFDRFLQFAAPTFDVSVFETFFPLFRGATLVTRHREHMLGDLSGTLTDLAIDAAELTPTVAGTLLRSREVAPCLRLLLTIGEMLTRPVIREFARSMGRESILLPMYGPTEASIHCTVAASVSTETKVGIIGRPLSTVTSLIIRETEESSNANIEVLPTGQVGELVIAGQLATGYLNRREQTEVAFRDHPNYGRLYRTGDRARLLPNGDLECLGRISTGQVKIRGQRVELGEIEQVVGRAEGVLSATASIIDDVLVAFCIASSKHLSREQVMSVCKSWLPSFMRPNDIVLVFDNIPRLPSGKVDKARLESDYRRQVKTTKSSNRSQSELESRIIQCVTTEMPRTVSPTDDLWTSGLDSIRAIKVASRLREYGFWLSVSDILAADNVSGLAKRLEAADPARILQSRPRLEMPYTLDSEALTAAVKAVAPGIDMNEVDGFRPCSPLQLAMLAETSRNSSLNFNRIEVQLPDFVSVLAFSEAFQHLAYHNKILRSGFIRTDVEQYPFCQIIWKHLDTKVQDSAAELNSHSSKCGTSDRILLYPLGLQFADRKGKRACIIHVHHALYDGWSFELILQDLENIVAGGRIQLRPQFDDVLKYQLQGRLEGPSEAARAYWQNHLHEAKLAPFPKLLTKQVQGSGRQTRTREFTLELHDLTSICRRSHVSRQSFLSAAFAILLSSYVGSLDVAFGAVSSGRTMPIQGIEKIIGPCIRVLPIRLDLSRLRTAKDVMNHAHQQYHNFLLFDNLLLSDIKSISGIAGEDLLFDSLLVWQEGPEVLQDPERVLTIIDTFDSLDYAIVLEIEPRDGKLQAKFSFDASKLSADHAMLFLNQLDSILTLSVRFPETPVGDCYGHMGKEDISMQNADFFAFNNKFTLTSTIDALAKEDSLRTAIEFVDVFDPKSGRLKTTTISYGELYRQSSHISHKLTSKGISSDDLVSIVMDKSVELYIVILGVIKSGAAYLAIDPRTPANRVRQILEDSRCRIVIGEGLSRDFTGSCELCSTAELESGSLDVICAIDPSCHRKRSSLAYVVYTSGSTGVPKGVLITRSNVLSNIDCLSRLYPASSDSKLLQACSQAFDVSVFEIFFTWHMGMSLCAAANDILFRDIEHLIRLMNVSHLSLTPSVAALVEPENVPTVKFLVTAGEPMNSKVFGSWIGRGLYQGYGPSETTNICNVRAEVNLSDFPNNVGPPLPNTSIFICQGEKFSLLPKGAVGEIWIGGDQVGRGYLFNDELTRKSFFDHATYGRLYRSGDIGRLLSDGSLVILGRRDDQVKLRGQRIELGDINQALIRSAVVKDAATFIVDASSNRDGRLVSFWTPNLPASGYTVLFEDETRALLANLEETLPGYMVPDALIPVDRIPLTRQGKVDRRKLIKQFEVFDLSLLQRFSRANEQEKDNSSLTQDETLIAQGVAEAVGCAPSAISRDISFFALGLDSINSIKLSQRLRKVGLGQVDISKILRHASVRRLARHLSSSTAASEQILVEAPLQPKTGRDFHDQWQRHVGARFADMGYDVTDILPSTPLQEVMLSSSGIHSSDSYQNKLVFHINGNLAEMQNSWDAMLSRHQLLRTGFATVESSVSAFAQVVLEKFTLPWSWDDTEPGQDSEDWLYRGFMAPPYTLKAARGANGRSSTLTLRMHHALYDGEAMNLLLKDVETHYLGGRLPPVVPLRHYIEYMLSLDQTSMDNFWHSQLDGHKSQLVTEIFSPAIQEKRQAHSTTHLVSGLPLSALEAELKHMSTTLLSIMQTSWARLLSLYLRTFDVCFGNVYSGRSIPVENADQIIGPCFNTLPVRVELKKLETTAELSRRLQQINTAVLAYQPSSLRRIQKGHGALERPLFDTILLLQPQPHALEASIWTLAEETGHMEFPLICEIIPDTINDQLRLALHVQGTHFPTSEARRLLENFDILLQHDIQYTQAQSRDFSVLKSNLPSLPCDPSTSGTSSLFLEPSRPNDSAEEALSSMEAKIRQKLSEASRTDIAQIKKRTSIFQLGLDSIDAIQIAAKLRREGFGVTGGDILEASTLERIAGLCSTHLASPKKAIPSFDLLSFDAVYRSQVCQQICIPPSTVEAIFPCTSTQSGILAEFIRSDGRLYFNSMTIKLTGIGDVNRVKEAWEYVALRHVILRTGFVEIENTDHPFAMVIYQSGIHQLPWKETVNGDNFPGRDIEGRRILEALYQPPWRLVYSKQGNDCLLKISILHALYDAQSLDIILADMAAACNGQELPPPEDIRPTLSSILSQSMVQRQESRSFFTNLGKSLGPTAFPNFKIHANELHGVSVEAQPCTKSQYDLRQGAKQAGISLHTAIQCAWARLLAAYTGRPDVTFGVILSSRISEKREDFVAFPTVNTLPMPLYVTEDAGVLMEQAAKLNSALMQRQFVPLTEIKKWLGMKRSFFDTVVVLQHRPSMTDGTALWEAVSDDAQTEHAVSLEVVPEARNRFMLRLTFQRNILPPEQAKMLLLQYEALLYSTIFPPHVENSPQMRQEPRIFSITPAKESRIATSTRFLHEMVEQSAQIRPERIALEFATSITDQQVSKRCWTYKSLDEEANKIAHLLLQQGASPGDLIGICFDKCPEASFAIFGTLKAGCAFVAIDPNAPQVRKDFILKDSACTALLCNRDRLESFQHVENLPVLALDEHMHNFSLSSECPKLSRELKPDDTCYCLYTSGTTGQPKGCLITHDNAVQALLFFKRIFTGRWNDDSRWLQFASYHFDVSVLEQFWSWSVGICVTSAPRDVIFEDIPGTIRALQITHLDLTPSLARLLKPEEVPSLYQGVFITGGEQLRHDVLDTWGDVGVLYNFYGPSEVTIGCTVNPRVTRSAKPSNIGRQFDNVGTFVLDLQTNKPVLRGAIGELCLSGPLVGKGYLNRPDLTKAKFEYLPEFATRIYHTGDLVRQLHDGSFEFLGRADDQVKLRGQRLELTEINHVLTQSNAELQDVATTLVRHPKQANDQLVSFLSWSKRSTKAVNLHILQDDRFRARVATIRQKCEDRLPGYMIPTYLVPVSLMPLSANNKVELNNLKSLFANTPIEDLQRLSTAGEYTSGVDLASTERIMGLLSMRLGLTAANITPSSNLFELGMDSISMIGFSRSLKEAGFGAAQPSLVMRHSTVAGLANALKAPSEANQLWDQLQKDASTRIADFSRKHRHYIAQMLGIQDDSIEKIAPCTPLQEGMISKTLQSDKPLYAPTFTYELSDDIDLQRLQDAWLSAQSQTDILRTQFIATQDGFAQVVLRTSDAQKCLVLSHLEDKYAREELQHDLESWYDSIKNLELMPWRVVLREGRDRNFMGVHIFHALFDGMSLPLLLGKVAQIYLGQDLVMVNPEFHEILPFGPLRIAEGAEAFWRKSLASKPLVLLDLPVRHVEHAERCSSLKTIKIPQLGSFNQLRLKLKVTMPPLFHACWLLVLHKHFKTVPTLGVVVSGRSIDVEGAQNVIGPMFNTLPCFIEFGPGLSASDLVQACHKFNIDSLPYQHTALRDISKWIAHDPSQPLFDSLFVFQNEAVAVNASSKLWTPRESTSELDFPLAVEVQQNLDNSFAVTIAAQPQYLDTEEVHELLKSFENAMHEMVEGPDQRLPSLLATPPRRDAREIPPQNTLFPSTAFVWTPAAKAIREMIATLANVGVDAVRANSTIFELGLDSIDAIRLCARLKAAGIPLSVSTIMQCATVEAMMEFCTQKPSKEFEEPPQMKFNKSLKILEQNLRSQGVQLHEYEKFLPVTPLQEGMLANIEQYYSYDVLELAPEVDLQRFKRSWRSLLNANPILRTSFIEIEDPGSAATYAQLVHKVGMEGNDSDFINWRELVVGSESQLDDILANEKLRVPQQDLQHSMLSLTLVKSKTRRFLILGMAHTIYDGWSISLLHQDIRSWYSGNAVERPPYEPALSYILNSRDDDSHRFWKATLGGVSPSLFPRHSKNHTIGGDGLGMLKEPVGPVKGPVVPADRPAHSAEGPTTMEQPVYEQQQIQRAQIDPESTVIRHDIQSTSTAESVQDFCKTQGITIQALGLTCYSAVLATRLRKLDVCFGLVLSGRTVEDFREMMFPTMNTVVFPATLEGTRSDTLKSVHGRSIQISEHQFFPLRKAKALSGVEGALFDALFIYQKKPQSNRHDPELYHSIDTSSGIEYPLNVEMELLGTDLVWRAACQDNILNKAEVSQMLFELDNILDEVMKYPNEPIVKPVATNIVDICGICTSLHLVDSKSTTLESTSALEEESAETTAEWSPLEKLVREVLATVSGFPEEHISRKTSLFNLGLDSISSVKVSSMLRKKSISLPVSVMLKTPTVEEMAAAAMQITPARPERQQSNNPADATTERTTHNTATARKGEYYPQPANTADHGHLIDASDYRKALENLKTTGIMPEDVENIMPITAGQDYVLGVWLSSGRRMFYSDFFYKSTDPGLTPKSLGKAWTETVRQLPILRTTFIVANGNQTLQVVVKFVSPVIWALDQGPNAQSDKMDGGVGDGPPPGVNVPVKLFATRSSSGIHIKLSIHHAL
jgi:ferricrocin synthase